MHGFSVAPRNLKQIGSGTASDFNVSGLLSKAEIAEGLFQQNRPTSAYCKQHFVIIGEPAVMVEGRLTFCARSYPAGSVVI